ncbi:TniQ family protein [Streptomyces sp. NBC_00385]|uniref:TniQ family protein n=1 Tax=Streptomyces sp. NBC_00385 TaxID=2975733 RepID=UPI002DDB963C|nr:TniQ family protein [Streptomyces sp. NBC_00385]WRZ03606.1 TniQ family protein [Streptomyces sp. NBC_00385]WRZ06920.1 TniQ family protein [Streptomyces sp. NBC_00385]
MIPTRVLPLRVAPLPGESLDSWLEALARRNHLRLRAMLDILQLPQAPTTRLLVSNLEPHLLRQLEHVTGLPDGRLDQAVLDPGFPLGPQRQPRCRFCPQCLDENNGRWLLRWWLPWGFACTTHQVLLHDVCPRCGTAPRRLLPPATHRRPPGSCLHTGADRSVCGTGLGTAPALDLPAGHPLLAAQRWIESLLAEKEPAEVHTIFADLDTCTAWLLRAVSAEDLHGLGAMVVDAWDHQPPPTRKTRLQPLSAPVRGILVHIAQPILAGSDKESIAAIRGLRQRHDSTGSPTPPGMDFHPWRQLSAPAHRRFLQAADPDMRPMDRLRLRSVTPRAGYPPTDSVFSTDRIRHLPQLLWPSWTVRLMPREGTDEDYFRAMASALLLLPGEPRRSTREITDRLHPHLSNTMGVVLRRSIDQHPDVLTALCRLADHLDDHGSAIDYQQRRALIPDEPITYDTWKQLCFDTGTQPGESPTSTSQTPRFVQAQRYLHNLLTGSDLADPAHPLAWKSAADRGRYFVFLPTLTLAQRQALHGHARAVLEKLNIAEPLTWEPPEDCAAGLMLPGRPLIDIDIDALKRIVFTEQRTLGEAARHLGTTLAHVRFALERVGPEPRQWTGRASPLVSWQLREQARAILTPEFFDREYNEQEKTLAQIAQEIDLPRHIVVEQAEAVGLTIYRSRRPLPIDETWLREQYLTQRRSTGNIAQQIGIEYETIRRRLKQLDIPLRPQGVHSRTVMIAQLDAAIPRDICAAVEGTLHGWLRLHRFHIAMAFPNLKTAGAYLGAEQTALTTQFQRLEADIGHTLIHRSVHTTSQRPTTRGKSLLQHIQRPDVQKLMNDALLPAQILCPPDAETIAGAEAAARRPRKHGHLKPFDGIAVQRLRIRQETVTLLEDLLHHADEEVYGAQIHARTGMAQGSISDQLRRLRRAGWLTSRPEDDDSWLRRATPGRGPGRRRTYYALTPEGAQAATHETQRYTLKKVTKQRDKTAAKNPRHPHENAGQPAAD